VITPAELNCCCCCCFRFLSCWISLRLFSTLWAWQAGANTLWRDGPSSYWLTRTRTKWTAWWAL